MGGLLIADAAKEVVDNGRPEDPLWPKIVGIFGQSSSVFREYQLIGSIRHALPWSTSSYIQTPPLTGCNILRTSPLSSLCSNDVIAPSRRLGIREMGIFERYRSRAIEVVSQRKRKGERERRDSYGNSIILVEIVYSLWPWSSGFRSSCWDGLL
jgi:hypothetical protein